MLHKEGNQVERISEARMGYHRFSVRGLGLMLTILITLLSVGCATQQPEQYACDGSPEKSASIDPASLWEDATKTTIGASGGSTWTNKVELADINGDGLVDVLFANGGNY